MIKAMVPIALIRLVGRIALIASVLLLTRGHYELGIALGLVASLAALAERAVASLVRARLESSLVRRALRAVFDSRAVISASTHAQTTIIGGVTDESRILAEVRPGVLADLLACVGVVALAASLHVEAQLASFLVFAASGLVIVVALRSRIARASTRAWAAFAEHNQSVIDGLEGAAELVAANRTDAFEASLISNLEKLRRQTRVLAVEATVIGRMPIAIAVVAAVALPYVTGTGLPNTADLAVLATMLTPFVGVATAASAYQQAAPSRRSLRELLALPRRQRGQRVVDALTSITLRGVRVRYGDVVALDGFSLAINGPGVFVLRGPNGSGKTTILRLLAGLIDIDEGDATIGDVGIAELDWTRMREKVNVLFQKPFFAAESTVGDSLRLLAGDVGDAALRAALERFDVWSVLARKNASAPLAVRVDSLSAGERQRVALSRLCARDASLYLLDEPDANLDRAGVARLCEVLTELSARAIVVVAAHTSDVEAIATRVLQLDMGATPTHGRGALNERSPEDRPS